MKIIDSHAHVFETLAGFGADGELRAIGNGLGKWGTGREERIIPAGFGDRSFVIETLFSIMERNNIEKCVLLQGGMLGFDNNYLASIMEKYPEKVVSAGAIDPFCRNKDIIFENLLKTFKVFKFESSTGCGLMGIHNTFRLDSKLMLDLYTEIERRDGISVFDIGSPSDESHQMDAIANIARIFPNMRIVVCHLASVKQKDRAILEDELEMIKPFDNVSFDVAALMWKTRPEEYPFPIAQSYVRIAKDIVGIERLMWGSDAPSTLCKFKMEDMIDCYLGLFTEREAELFYYENANRLYFNT